MVGGNTGSGSEDPSARSGDKKGFIWGSGNTRGQDRQKVENREIIKYSTEGHRQKRSQREHRLGVNTE